MQKLGPTVFGQLVLDQRLDLLAAARDSLHDAVGRVAALVAHGAGGRGPEGIHGHARGERDRIERLGLGDMTGGTPDHGVHRARMLDG